MHFHVTPEQKLCEAAAAGAEGQITEKTANLAAVGAKVLVINTLEATKV